MSAAPVFRKLNLEQLRIDIAGRFSQVLQAEPVRPEPETSLQEQAEDLFKEALALLSRP